MIFSGLFRVASDTEVFICSVGSIDLGDISCPFPWPDFIEKAGTASPFMASFSPVGNEIILTFRSERRLGTVKKQPGRDV